MNWAAFENVLNVTPWWVMTPAMLGGMALAAWLGLFLRVRFVKLEDGKTDDEAGYVVPAVMGLLALLLGFTFALAIDRFENRRELVLSDANAIQTGYLQSQLLPEPHRTRISGLLLRYAENRIKLGGAKPGEARGLLAENSRIITDLWAGTSAAFDDIKGLDFSSTYVSTMNTLIETDAARQAARHAHIPGKVFAMLYLYALATSGVLSYALASRRGRVAAGVLLLLMQSALALIIDIDRPTLGGVNESQEPMIALQDTLRAQPPAAFDRYRPPSRP